MVSFVGKDVGDLFKSLQAFREIETVFYTKATAAPIEELSEPDAEPLSAIESSPSAAAQVNPPIFGPGGIGLSIFSRPTVNEQQPPKTTQVASPRTCHF
jgi:hypothetical protein